jgi:hypothetical protein
MNNATHFTGPGFFHAPGMGVLLEESNRDNLSGLDLLCKLPYRHTLPAYGTWGATEALKNSRI